MLKTNKTWCLNPQKRDAIVANREKTAHKNTNSTFISTGFICGYFTKGFPNLQGFSRLPKMMPPDEWNLDTVIYVLKYYKIYLYIWFGNPGSPQLTWSISKWFAENCKITIYKSYQLIRDCFFPSTAAPSDSKSLYHTFCANKFRNKKQSHFPTTMVTFLPKKNTVQFKWQGNSYINTAPPSSREFHPIPRSQWSWVQFFLLSLCVAPVNCSRALIAPYSSAIASMPQPALESSNSRCLRSIPVPFAAASSLGGSLVSVVPIPLKLEVLQSFSAPLLTFSVGARWPSPSPPSGSPMPVFFSEYV